jgi:multicomponent Na+:H+ antiporter subunit E
MTGLLANVLLAIAWVAMTGRFELGDLAAGFAIGYVILGASQRIVGRSAYVGFVRRLVRFLATYVVDLVRANIRVAHDVVTPRHMMQPAIVAIPLDVHSDVAITALANLIGMTPGTLPIDVSDDRTVLYLHVMYVDDPDEIRREIKDGLERRVLELIG